MKRMKIYEYSSDSDSDDDKPFDSADNFRRTSSLQRWAKGWYGFLSTGVVEGACWIPHSPSNCGKEIPGFTSDICSLWTIVLSLREHFEQEEIIFVNRKCW